MYLKSRMGDREVINPLLNTPLNPQVYPSFDVALVILLKVRGYSRGKNIHHYTYTHVPLKTDAGYHLRYSRKAADYLQK